MHAFRSRWVLLALLAAGCMPTARVARAAEDAAPGDADHALLKAYCVRCHNAEKPKGDVDLSAFGTRPNSLQDRKIWRKVLEQLQNEEMPPDDPLPSDDERRQLIAWAERGLKVDGTRRPNPGRVTIPRLTREEYNNTMRDLLGIDLKPGDEFAADGEGESGFNTDRDALFLTPALMEKYLAAATAALDACAALEHEPARLHFESEAMFMTETRETPRDFGDGFTGYVLNRGQMTLYDSVRFPADGFYTFAARVRSAGAGAPCGARLRIDGEARGDIVAASRTPETLTVTCFVKAGSRQMTWNIEAPEPRPLPMRPPGRLAQGQPRGTGPLSPQAVNAIVSRESEKNAPVYPASGKEPEEIRALVQRLDGAALAVQRPHEQLRLLGAGGDPGEIGRFKSYVIQRGKFLDDAKTALAEALGQAREEFDRHYEGHNRERLADNRKLLEAVAHVPVADLPAFANANPPRPGANPARPPNNPMGARSIGIDWVEVRGPIHPDGAGRRSRVFVAQPGEGLTKRQAAEKILAGFLPRAFRRPVDDAQLGRYLAFYDRAEQRGDAFEPAIKLALSAALVSPHFLYRNEFGPVDGKYRLDDYQVAARLSYFLWMSMPDDTLFALADAGRLHEPEVLSTQVDRMLADPKARAFTSTFLGQWLGFESLGRGVRPDESRFPQFTPELCAAMKEETILAFESLLRQNGSLLELLDTRETWLNEPLVRLYGIDGVRGDAMRRVRLDDPNRGGLLGMASVLTVTSGPTRTNPVVRGKWVLETLLGEPIPQPPADAGTLDPSAGEDRGKTLREELLQHRRNATCATCHNTIDPIGFGLENFDAIGRFRTREAGRPIDNAGELPGGATFRGPVELKQMLVNERPAPFIRNVAERLLSFALGRKLELFDEPALMEITAAVEGDGRRAGTLVKQIVLSYPFQYQNNQGTLE